MTQDRLCYSSSEAPNVARTILCILSILYKIPPPSGRPLLTFLCLLIPSLSRRYVQWWLANRCSPAGGLRPGVPAPALGLAYPRHGVPLPRSWRTPASHRTSHNRRCNQSSESSSSRSPHMAFSLWRFLLDLHGPLPFSLSAFHASSLSHTQLFCFFFIPSFHPSFHFALWPNHYG
jgi:hypothetical protein